MIKIVCPFCGATTEMVPARHEIEGDGVLAEHNQPGSARCRWSGFVVQAPLPPRDCKTCGVPLSLEIRSRQAGVYSRQHMPQDCIAALRDRVAALEAWVRQRP